MSTTNEALAQELVEIKDAGLYKKERIITTPQGPSKMQFCTQQLLMQMVAFSSHF